MWLSIARPRVLFAVLTLVFAAMAGCGDDDNDAAGTNTPNATLTGGSTATPTREPFAGGTDPVNASPEPASEAAILVDVRIGEHLGYDRITFEFTNGLPGYSVQYVEPPIIADASGEEVDIAGRAFIQVRMEPAAGHDPDTGDPTYDGPLEMIVGMGAIVEAERTGDFEGVLTWVVGVNKSIDLSENLDFRVSTVGSPPRLVIDVAHP